MTSAASLISLSVTFFAVIEVAILSLLFVMLRWLPVCLACRCSDCLMSKEHSAWFLSVANSLVQ